MNITHRIATSCVFLSLSAIPASAGYADLMSLFPQFNAAQSQSAPESYASPGRAVGSGVATWYGPGFHGRRTASGERFNTHDLTAAHRSLPFGTRVRVEGASGRSVVVRINDRGPFTRGRVIDLSRAAANAIGMGGTMRVNLVVLGG